MHAYTKTALVACYVIPCFAFHSINISASIVHPPKTNSLLAGDVTRAQPPLHERLASRDRQRYEALLTRAGGQVSPSLRRRQQDQPDNVAVVNEVTFYSVELDVGSPPSKHKVIVDTGSSNSWIIDDYIETSSSRNTGQEFQVTYGSGAVTGTQYVDTVQIGDLIAENQGIGVAVEHTGFDDAGLGPSSLTVDTVGNGTMQIDTIVDTLFNQSKIEARVVGCYFAPSTDLVSTNGLLTFGGIDPSLFGEKLVEAPASTSFPASEYFSVDMTFEFAGQQLLPQPVGGLSDTGTTLNLVASDIFAAYAIRLADFGGVFSRSLGLLAVPTDRVKDVPDFNFIVNGVRLPLIGDAQFFPEDVNDFLEIPTNLSRGMRFSTFADLGISSGQGLDFILGMKTLERFASTYNGANQSIAFYSTAATSKTYEEMAASTDAFEPAFTTDAATPPEDGGDKKSSGFSLFPTVSTFLSSILFLAYLHI